MKDRVRTVFYLHPALAVYCIVSGGLDALGYYRYWIFPSAAVLLILLASAIVLPFVAAGLVFNLNHPRRVAVIAAHAAMSFGQLLGLVESIS